MSTQDPNDEPTGQEPVTGPTTELNEEDAAAALEPAAPAEPAAPEVSLTTKIVIVEGERFSMPYDTPEAQVRDNLRTIYPGIGTARASKGTIVIEGVTYETLEFVKQAGTKGVAEPPHPLLALRQLQRQPIGAIPDFRNVRMLRLGRLTFEQALDLTLFDNHRPTASSGSHRLCQLLEDLSAAAAGPELTVPGWSA